MRANRKGGHSQVPLVLTKKIKADTAIAPLVAWMNKQHGIITHMSCQGGHEVRCITTGHPRLSKPWVAFHAITRNALYKMLRRMGLDRGHYQDESLGLRLDWWEYHGNTNYRLQWEDCPSLNRTIRALDLLEKEEP